MNLQPYIESLANIIGANSFDLLTEDEKAG